MQDNHSRSARNVLRGLHYQIRQPQGKLVRVIAGEIFDVAVDLRRSSPTFGKWVGVTLDRRHPRACCGSRRASRTASSCSPSTPIVLYKTTDYYAPEHERTLLWNDPALGIRWPLEGEPIVSDKDRRGAAVRASADLFD